MTTKAKSDRARRAAPATGGKPKDTKKAQLIRLLSAKAGADVRAISSKLGWQPHTTRAAITGLKKAGYEVTTERTEPDKPTRYRIEAKPKASDPVAKTPEPAHAG
ncbi:DUF3489 domain-containing protein [Defluviimonas sp. SAOS-178_SWC]|uniref:DUF3489 domain-containing protein n=1 Tax=Defluviimonas sp. SAOS-178_SWC TaxID=3121287 RepID=UPI003221AA5B